MKQQQIHGRFMALSCAFMALSWHFVFGFAMKVPWICHESAMKQQIHGTFMALSWHFPGTSPLGMFGFAIKVPWWNLHVRFMADSSRIHRGFMPVSFSPKKSKSCQIHVTFMAVSWHFHIPALLGYSLPKSIGKSYPKSRCWLSIWFFLPNFSFIFSNMSDSCRFHGPFMALSSLWFFWFFPEKNPNQQLNPSQKWPSSLNVRFIANSSRIHGAFMSLSWHFPAASDSSRIHVTFMALSHTSLTWVKSAKIYWKKLSKKSVVLVVDMFFLPNFSFIFGNMSDSCRFHGPFMALSLRFLPSDFYCFSKQFHGICMADSWQIHGTFLALSWHCSWHFPACLDLKVPWKCHESAKPRWNLHVRFMSICVCLFVSVYLCVYLSSVFFWCYFHWWFFRFRLINFFWGFLWSKYRVIRNTQTTNPNQQLTVDWFWIDAWDFFDYSTKNQNLKICP